MVIILAIDMDPSIETRVIKSAQPIRILIANAKGGCGKTTLATNLASHFATMHNKTVLIDFDPQTNLTIGLDCYDDEENIGRYIKEVIHFRSPQVKPKVINNYVHIIPATRNLLEIDTLLHDTVRGERVLGEIIFPLTMQEWP